MWLGARLWLSGGSPAPAHLVWRARPRRPAPLAPAPALAPPPFRRPARGPRTPPRSSLSQWPAGTPGDYCLVEGPNADGHTVCPADSPI
jgi:hypothetical protein